MSFQSVLRARNVILNLVRHDRVENPIEGCFMAKAANLTLAGLSAGWMLIASANAQPDNIAKISAISSKSAVAIGTASDRSSSKIKFGEQTAIPSGYYDMCTAHKSLCQIRSGRLPISPDGSVKLTGLAMNQLSSVNAAVNASIRPAYRDGWMPGRTVGDCKDFALTKQHRLIASGWPSSAVPVAIVRTRSGERHLVLVARTNQGDFVLDNLTESVVPWTSVSYSWEKIQSTTNSWVWRTI
jgi:predicted transglutaminase-like cysteine proteinase